MDKRARRRKCFARIGELSEAEKVRHSAAIAAHLEKSEWFRQATTVFSFIALPSEPDLGELFDRFPDKRWAFSRVESSGGLAFHYVAKRDQLHLGDFGFSEPNPEVCPGATPDDAGLILIPGVSFDPATGARLGRGKGHYDRYLGQLHERPPLAGVCFSTQFSTLDPEDHDVPMDAMVAETGWHMSAVRGD